MLLDVTTGYFRLLQVTTCFYRILQATKCYYRVLQVTTGYFRLRGHVETQNATFVIVLYLCCKTGSPSRLDVLEIPLCSGYIFLTLGSTQNCYTCNCCHKALCTLLNFCPEVQLRRNPPRQYRRVGSHSR